MNTLTELEDTSRAWFGADCAGMESPARYLAAYRDGSRSCSICSGSPQKWAVGWWEWGLIATEVLSWECGGRALWLWRLCFFIAAFLPPLAVNQGTSWWPAPACVSRHGEQLCFPLVDLANRAIFHISGQEGVRDVPAWTVTVSVVSHTWSLIAQVSL